jgi:hypothetical protein
MTDLLMLMLKLLAVNYITQISFLGPVDTLALIKGFGLTMLLAEVQKIVINNVTILPGDNIIVIQLQNVFNYSVLIAVLIKIMLN